MYAQFNLGPGYKTEPVSAGTMPKPCAVSTKYMSMASWESIDEAKAQEWKMNAKAAMHR